MERVNIAIDWRNPERSLKEKYLELHPQGFFFSESTMDFFNSEIEWVSSDGYFITSERMNLDLDKRYTIRQLVSTQEQVKTHGEFQMYGSLKHALQAYSFAYEHQPHVYLADDMEEQSIPFTICTGDCRFGESS